MKLTVRILTAVLILSCSRALANFSGGDDFNDNSRDVGKWDEFASSSDRSLVEANGHLEMRSSGNEVVEPAWDAGVWQWIENAGSTTQDWTVTYTTVNLLDETAMSDEEVWFGIFAAAGPVGVVDNGISIDVIKGNFGDAFHEVGFEGSVDDTTVLSETVSITNDTLTVRMQYDAFSQRIYCSYDEGNGFQDLGSMSIVDWGMGPADEFKLYLFGGTTDTPVTSGQVYGDNLVLMPTSDYVEPPTIIGYSNFSGSDDFNDNSIDSARWSNLQDGSQAAFTEVNRRFEYTSPAAGGTEDDRSELWGWAANQGSYTQSWTITFQAANMIDASSLPDEQENWFGLGVSDDPATFSNTFVIGFNKGKVGNSPYSRVVTEANTADITVLEQQQDVTNDVLTLRVSYDALTQTLYSHYDDGHGFMPLESMNVEDWGMDAGDRFAAALFSGNNGMIITSGQVYADQIILEPSAEHLNESGAELAAHIHDLEIFGGLDLEAGVFRVEFDLWSDGTFEQVWVHAPFGTFECVEDWTDWEYESDFPTNALPDLDGNWQIVVIRTNGMSGTTTIPFLQDDGLTPIPDIFTCPALLTPVLPDTWIFETNVTFSWDSDFHPAANLAGIQGWNSLTDVDFDYAQYEGVIPTNRSVGPVTLPAGLAEYLIYNGFVVTTTNADSIPCDLGKYAFHMNQVSVIDPLWDEDLDGMSNEFEMQHFGGVTNGTPGEDLDGDGSDNVSEFRAGTLPDDPESFFEISLSPDFNDDELTVSWTTSPGREYDVFWSSNLLHGFELLDAFLTAPVMPIVDPLHDAGFYRVNIWRDITAPGGVRRADISIDGDVSDWAGLSPQLTDPSGDGGLFDGLDITAITVALGPTNLFLKIDRAGAEIETNALYSSHIWIDLRSGERGFDYNMGLDMDEWGTNAWLQAYMGTNWYEVSSWMDTSIAFGGNSIELAFPLEPSQGSAYPHSSLMLNDRYNLSFGTRTVYDWHWDEAANDDENYDGSIILMPY